MRYAWRIDTPETLGFDQGDAEWNEDAVVALEDHEPEDEDADYIDEDELAERLGGDEAEDLDDDDDDLDDDEDDTFEEDLEQEFSEEDEVELDPDADDLED